MVSDRKALHQGQGSDRESFQIEHVSIYSLISAYAFTAFGGLVSIPVSSGSLVPGLNSVSQSANLQYFAILTTNVFNEKHGEKYCDSE